MQFSERRFRHDNLVVLSFRKALSRKSNMTLVLLEEAYDEVIGEGLNESFSQSVQDLAVSKVANELSACCAP